MKDAPNHILMNMFGSSQTSSEILEDSDILIFMVVLITPTRMVIITGHNLGSNYTPSAWRLIQTVYNHIFSVSVRHEIPHATHFRRIFTF